MLIILLVISVLMPSKSVFKRNSVVKLILIMCNKKIKNVQTMTYLFKIV